MRKITILIVWALLMVTGQAFGQGVTLFDHADFIIEHPDSVNSIASDISPCIIGSQLYYSSVRKSWWEKQSRLRKNIAFYNQYQVPLDTRGQIKKGIGRQLVPGLGNDYHQGPVSYCAATGELFVTQSNTSNPDSVRRMVPRTNIRLKLVIMKRESGEWEKTGELPFNDKRYHYAHPAISAMGDTLVFSSDMPGGRGQSDLYMSVRKSGQWGMPVNLGEVVNTTGNEMFPTFLPGGLLSFASNGHPGCYGFLDIWYTTFPKISQVKNAGEKINTQFDDFGLIIGTSLEVGYLSSNRQGTGSDDIFRVDIIARSRILKGRVPVARTGQPVLLCHKEVEKSFVLKNINYDYDKWDILSESEIELDKLVQVMNDKRGIKVELGSHTDARGNNQYNMRLSQKRSDSAVNYIVSKGIDRSRIIAKGYGETQIINHCKNGENCPDWEHRQNRRTEFKIIGL